MKKNIFVKKVAVLTIFIIFFGLTVAPSIKGYTNDCVNGENKGLNGLLVVNGSTVRATTSFKVSPRFQIEHVRGGLGKIHAKISNLFGKDLQNITWNIFVVPNGGFFTFDENSTNGTISVLKANETASIETTGFLRGLGFIQLSVTAKVGTETSTKVGNGFILFFMIVCRAR